MLKKVLESRMKIRFHDCDPFSHLNNSRYMDYIMTARGDQVQEDYGLDIYKMAKEEGLGWVSAQTQIAYMVPAYLMEEVVIQTQLTAFSGRSLSVEALMWNEDKTVLKALVWIRLVHYQLQMQKSHTHSEALMRLFKQVVSPLKPEMDFETRVKDLKAKVSVL
ncbi:acyl-CoA thioesterase [Niabella sp. CC-SYL272]|uniref:acyl-CoA thioesterase n=1 Tax=Niabella agricola TaxID=2891571 RepID=UPI001F1C7638|nr:acyl-CoA thioesterase [Niabella agricola]MCF3111777.1 acyl-CoA thioesterase [Niabella agricola]